MDNQSNQSAALDPNDATPSVNLKISLFTILIVCSFFANLLVITIVYCNSHLRTNFNYLIVNMAISDFVVPLVAIPMILTMELTNYEWKVEGPLGNALCKLCYFLIDVTPGVSVYSLVIIAVNRFIAIVYPMHVNTFNKKRHARVLILLPWIISMAFCSYIFYAIRLASINGVSQCIFSWEPAFDNKIALPLYVIIILVIFYIFPFITILVLYTIMLLKIHQSSENVSTMIQDCQSRKYRDRQIFYLSIAIVVAFGLLWGPSFIYNVYQTFAHSINPIIGFVFYIMAWSNAVVNPLICILFNGNFRRGLKKLCRKKLLRRRSVAAQSRRTRTTRHYSKDIDSSKSNGLDRYQVITAV